jgi:hypothetical protein
MPGAKASKGPGDGLVLVGVARSWPLSEPERPQADSAAAMFASDGSAFLMGQGLEEGAGPEFGERSVLVMKLERDTGTLCARVDGSDDIYELGELPGPPDAEWWAVMAAREEGTVLAVEPVTDDDRY